MCVDGEPHKSIRPASTPGIVRGADELAKRQGLLPVIRFHDLKYGWQNAQLPYGVHPMPDSIKSAPGLPHNDFRRAHHQDRRPHDDFVVVFVSRVPATPVVGYNASGGGEKGGDANK